MFYFALSMYLSNATVCLFTYKEFQMDNQEGRAAVS